MTDFHEQEAAVLGLRLRLIDNGYRITPIRTWGQKKGRGKAPYLVGWQKLFPTAVDATWKSRSTGIICGTQADGSHLMAVDIDILDAELALEVEHQVQAILGETPLLRIGHAPKRLLLYRCQFSSTKLRFVEGGVELLAEGNQFVAFGLHPDTRRPYEWPTGHTPENAPLDTVPTTASEKVQAFLGWLGNRLTPLRPVDDQAEGRHGDQPIVTGADGLVRDGREVLLRDIVWRAFWESLPNPTIEGVSIASWEEFTRRAFLGDGKWKYHDCVVKVRNIIRRWKAGEIAIADPAPGAHWPRQPEIDAAELSRRIDGDLADFAAGASMALCYPPGWRPCGPARGPVVRWRAGITSSAPYCPIGCPCCCSMEPFTPPLPALCLAMGWKSAMQPCSAISLWSRSAT